MPISWVRGFVGFSCGSVGDKAGDGGGGGGGSREYLTAACRFGTALLALSLSVTDGGGGSSISVEAGTVV
ncbi:hypothetical protein MGN70_003430 [Eutypa lata]|nr:hypothetical protein MGN70_003430 [Eutypa lata]